MSRPAPDSGRFQRRTPSSVTPITAAGRPNGADPGPSSDADALMSFGAEGAAESQAPVKTAPSAAQRYRLSVTSLSLAAGVLALIAGGIAALAYYSPNTVEPGAAAATPVVSIGSVTINSQPAGAEVTVDGVVRGATPVKLSLSAGDHQLQVRSADTVRELPLTVEADTSSTHYIEFAAAEAAPSTGRLEVASDPSGADVRLDGVLAGKTPLTLQTVTPGEHRVTITSGDTTITRTVRVTAGATASVVASAAPAGVSAGWVSIDAPFELEIFEDGDLIGTSQAERLMLPAGRHTLEVTNSAFEFRQNITVTVAAGKTSSSAITVPNGSLSVNALPWAEVSIDGRSVGTTPLGNLSVPVGTHEIVWRHPQMGERRRSVSVTAKTPVRIGVDFRQ